MILRRVIVHFRKQEWTAIAIDFLIVVMGVFIGIQVANFNEARGDRVREEQYIVRLTRDFERIIARSESAVDRWDSVLTSAERLKGDIAAFDANGEAPRPMEEIRRDFDRVTQGRIPAPPAATFVEMLSAGEVGLIRSGEIRDALLAYNEQAHYGLEAYRVLLDRSVSAVNTLAEFSEIEPPDEARNLYDDDAVIVSSVDFEKLAAGAAGLTALNILAAAADNHRSLTVVHLDRARAALAALEKGE